MFEYSIAHWVAFFTAAILLNLSPGPDMAYILGQSIRGGKRAGFMAMFGIWTGAFFHVILAAAGLSAILAASAVAFGVVKWIGVVYLIWLGIQAFRSQDAFGISADIDDNSHSVFKQGVLIATLNPKVAIFFLAFLPQFIVDGAGPESAQLFLHGILVIVAAAVVEPPLILAGSKVTTMLRNNEKIGIWIERALGSMFIILSARLAFAERT